MCRLPWWLRWQRIRLQGRRSGCDPWVAKISWRRERHTYTKEYYSAIKGQSHAVYSNHCKSKRWEWEVATHPSVVARKIAWTEKPAGLRSMGLQRVGQAWAQHKNSNMDGPRDHRAEWRKSDKDKYHVITVTDVENKLMATGKGQGRENWEIRVDIYILLYNN